MQKAVKVATLADLIFLMMLMLSGSLGGAVSDIVYFLAFLIPFAIGFYYSKVLRTEREEEAGAAEAQERLFTLDKKGALSLVPVIFPAIAVIFSLAALTSLLLTSLGFSSTSVENAGILEMIVLHALAPAVFEEMLFRYIPLKLLLPYSRRCCVLLSALYFSLIHANLFQMPYAFAAGVIFMLLDVALESVWPSLILHFLNNLLSIVWIKYCTGTDSMIIFIAILISLAAASLAIIVKRRRTYALYLGNSFSKGSGFYLGNAPVALIVLSLYIAIMNLFT